MRNRIRKNVLIGWIILTGVLIFSFGFAEAKERVFIHGDAHTIPTLDPLATRTTGVLNLQRNIYMSLLRYKFNTYGEIEGDLAKEWSVSSDGLIWTFKLRDNIKWHKGFGKVTAHDVKFSIDRIMDPKINSPHRGDFMEVREVRVVDDYTVRIFLKLRDATFLHKCTRNKPLPIVCQKAVEQYGQAIGQNPIGSGPFIFESMDREQTVLVANKEYYEGPPEIDRLVSKVIPNLETLVMALARGDVHLSWMLTQEKEQLNMLRAKGLVVKGIDRGQAASLLINPRVKPLDDLRIRKAIAHAINKDEIATHILQGFGERWDSLVPKNAFGYTLDGVPQYEYNPEKAKKYLAEAGYPNGLELPIVSTNAPTNLPIALAIQGQVAKVGIKLKMDVSDMSAHMQLVTSGNCAMSVYPAIRPPDADIPLMNFLHSSGFSPGSNLSRFNKLDTWIEAAGTEMDPKRRLKMYAEIQRVAMDYLPHIPICMLIHTTAHIPDITGVPDRDAGYGIDFHAIRFKK